MQRDILFVLKEKFVDGLGQPFYCPHCAESRAFSDTFLNCGINHISIGRSWFRKKPDEAE